MIEREILLIDDDSMSLFINEHIISDETTTPIRCFNSGKQGLEYIHECKNVTELMLFLDLNMPEMNGWDVLNALKASEFDASIRVFILTSSVDERDEIRARCYPMVENFLHKPLDASQVKSLWPAS